MYIKYNYNVKSIKQTLIIVLILVSSIGLFSIKFLFNNSDIPLDITNDKDIQVSGSLDYQNTSFVSKYLNIEINLKEYRLLSKQEMIDYLNLNKDYYNNDSIEERLDNEESHYELIADSNDKSSINIIVSKPKLLPSIKDLMSLYDEEEIEELIDDYKTKGFSYIYIKSYTKDFLKEERFVLDVAYVDQDDNPVHIRDIYISNKSYQGIIRLISDSNNNLDLMEERFSVHETKDRL